jgi:hypothetical protein
MYLAIFSHKCNGKAIFDLDIGIWEVIAFG